MAMKVDPYAGKTIRVVPVNPCFAKAECCFTCGTHSFSFEITKISDTKLKWTNNKVCYICNPTPCPCIPVCPFPLGPCAQEPKFVLDESDPTKWLGSGESVFAGGCCVSQTHNKGDVFIFSPEKDGTTMEKAMEYHTGAAPTAPPCFQNVFLAKGVLVDSTFKYNAGAPVANAEMVR